jgi:RimJ/RimL family protein N-acetyltransferase
MIQLEPFTEADIGRLIGWVTSEETHILWTASFFEYPLTREPFLKLLRESAERGDRLFYKAVDSATGEAVGHIELGAIDRLNLSTRIGRVLVSPEAQGRGVGTAMMRAALEIAFGQMGMHRVDLWVFDVNERAIACYEKLGFQHEGLCRESFKGPEGYWGMIIMSMLESEWRP